MMKFLNNNLLQQALTHKSWVNENPVNNGTNERLEFLGDAILEFIVSKEIYDRFPKEEEGYLTALRANLVNTKNLSRVALNLKIGEMILLSKGEEDGGGRNNPSLLADTVEAIIGALFIDQGINVAEKFVKDNILIDIEEKTKTTLKDPKSLLQEKIQAQGLPAPKYQVAEEDGPDHNKIFTIEVIIDGKEKTKGIGKSKSEAEQDAAMNALRNMVK
ncbi:MAG: Ribonuclease 3 [Candidatus Woesebacteria bacterium GW2011_GWC2_33_12]|uniref:Ribonuclease 3 n=1 Tax=Candidatus Woesebacteria bacterium GW2011_GWB1_33_22 TaxID=1618566 RepID=A0A0G0A238_9BACT|nr:MAG: Ribonuclease 3 [Candidatus Woesebacteria bacterium GW2011_GWC2_33_12]KKP42468.1 MAG: Ribonuclease 3 [Candidatus Woesebacteria bacterium GW2011_GWA2_33_20]KKP45211.1 MAG: Ribonuclease 3 [Candidatus Woesebacteria bacterium GW2011_GWB1_33_22]KKP46210.1 MAG: Ribonuclease 3 [Microgenomates group bacterium GW2011_GWC1_33_28]KKP50880.1 MAG: Ribonuclease 3 [Candidatus Woesebacteria bacterium GW2011_GWA1_33_33]HCR35754.1 ribonuclease III [Candidatus Woesebacteria bacterium]